MADERLDSVVEPYWREWGEALAGLDTSEQGKLAAAIGALDSVWDHHLFQFAETFGGTEVGYARALSAAVLERLLGVEYVALVSAAASEIPPTGDESLDTSLARARQEALDTFSDGLLGPVKVGDALVYAQPMLLDSPVPIGAVVLASRRTLTKQQETMLGAFLRHFDTRLGAAEELLKLRRRNLDLEFEVKKLKGEVTAPAPAKRVARAIIPEDVERTLGELAAAVPKLDLFGVSLPSEHFLEFCHNFDSITNAYLKILETAEHLYLDVPSGVDAKDEDSKLAAPYLRLLRVIGSLKRAAGLLFQVTADDLAPYAAAGRAPDFADLTRVAGKLAEDETTGRILEIMNDQGEEAELGALAARSQPYEFRAANTGEVFALLALHTTIKSRMPDQFQSLGRPILDALRTYQAARAYLLSYDAFEDVPIRGADRTQPPDSEKLLLYRENAPAFVVLLAALGR